MTFPKPIIPARRAANWYYGNYLMNPANALREEEGYCERAYSEMEKLSAELEGRMLTHREFLTIVKDKGIHARLYLYKKPEKTRCGLCRTLGIK